jgi:bacteriocin biosynthesis cyclodehydratase domain-containing protein
MPWSKRLLHVISVDAFGAAVLAQLRLSSTVADRVVSHSTDEEIKHLVEQDPDACYVVASGRPARRLCLDLDRHCHGVGARFIPATIETSTLQIGPVITPGQSRCWECSNERITSHHPFPDGRQILQISCDKEFNLRPVGFTPYIAAIAAQRICAAESNHEVTSSNQIWRMNIFTRDVSITQYVGRHGCHKCGSRTVNAERSLSHILCYLRA